MHNHNLPIPTKNTRKLIQSIFNKGFNCVVPEFIYYDNLLKDLGFAKLYTNEDPFYSGYTALWVKKNPEFVENKPLRSSARIDSNMKNIQVFLYYAQNVLELNKLYLVDWFLRKGDTIKLGEIADLFEIPENLLKIRLNHLKRKGFVIFDKKSKAYKSALTKKALNKRREDFPKADSVEYCKKKSLLDIATVISYFYKKKTKLEAIFNKPDLNKEINVIWENQVSVKSKNDGALRFLDEILRKSQKKRKYNFMRNIGLNLSFFRTFLKKWRKKYLFVIREN